MIQIRHKLGVYRKRFFNIIATIIEPHSSISDPEDHHRSRLLNSLLVIYTPIAIFIVIFRQLIFPEDTGTTHVITLVGLIVVGIIYAFGRMGHYRTSLCVTVLLGYGVIYFNAVNSSPPHFEIAYLIFLPLLGIVVFSMTQALLNYVVAFSLLVIFLVTAGDMEQQVAIDLFIFMILTLGFILLANYQRSRLDENRRELAIEKERTTVVKQLIDNVSHDFKTPLSIIHTNLYLMRHVDTPQKREQGFASIEQQAFRLESMIQDLLMISKLDYDTLPDYTDVNLEQLINDVIHQLSPVATMKQITLESHIDTNIRHISGYYDELDRMMVNLIENALNYTPEKGNVIINVSSCDSGCLQLDISDTGIGISDDDMQHIFERFYRADKARANHTGGTGLGLAIVKRIVERHHGTISVKSELGVGTTFSITLPVFQTSGSAESIAPDQRLR